MPPVERQVRSFGLSIGATRKTFAGRPGATPPPVKGRNQARARWKPEVFNAASNLNVPYSPTLEKKSTPFSSYGFLPSPPRPPENRPGSKKKTRSSKQTLNSPLKKSVLRQPAPFCPSLSPSSASQILDDIPDMASVLLLDLNENASLLATKNFFNGLLTALNSVPFSLCP